MKKFLSGSLALTIAISSLFATQITPASAAQVTSEVVNVDFTTTTPSGSTITNTAAGSLANLTIHGSPTLNSTTGASFPNTTPGSTGNYLTGNLGTTTDMSKITVEFTAKFTDTGCAAQNSGSMVFGLGSSGSSLAYYNIYRHSNFIGFNTFNSDIYGISIPDTTSFHSYKFVMLPYPANATSAQEIWVDGVKQSTAFRTTSVGVGTCSAITGTGETASERKFTRGSYSNGDFMFMTHPLNANAWGTTGSVQNLKITTVITNATIVAPDAPSIGSITAGDAQLSIPFTAPAYNGGASITNYKYSTDGGSTWISAASTTSPIVVSGLTNGTAYNVKLRAVNSAGDGTPSSGVSATPVAPVVAPGAPTIGSITAGDGQLSVPFTAPTSDGGATITDYKYSTDNGTIWTSAVTRNSPIVITGLTNGVSYNVKLRAVNSAGDGTASTAVTATPVQPAPPSSPSGPAPAPGPTAPPAQVESVAITKAVGSSGSLLKVKLDTQSGANSGSNVQVRLLDLKGKLIQVLTIPVTTSTSVIEVPVSLAPGDFTVEAVAVNSVGESIPVAATPTYLPKPFFKVVSGSQNPVLQGKKVADPIYFAADSAVLTADAKAALLAVLAKVTKPNARVAITGFTASRNMGTAVEKKLAAARALQVAKFLKANAPNIWIFYAGFGALKNGQNYSAARKVELRIIN